MFTHPPQRDYTRWLLPATAPFVIGALMGCTHSLIAAAFLTLLQLIPYVARLRPAQAPS